MLRNFRSALMIGAVLCAPVAFAQAPPGSGPSAPDAAATEAAAAEAEAAAWIAKFEAALDRRTGDIPLSSGGVTLHVPDDFYYLDPEDTNAVLVDAWGNPPSDEAPLGMLFPAEYSPLDEASWGVIIRYEDTGHVSDSDAEKINYDDLLKEMQAAQVEENRYRAEEGFEPIQVVGWAATPRYDAGSHKLYWAKELKFGEMEENTLNYDMRALGRTGVLSLNFVAAIDDLPAIEAAAPKVLAIPEFKPGSRYEDFDPKFDKDSGMGLAALVAGGGAAVLAKKTGLLAILLIVLKKGWVVILAGILGAGGVVKRFLGRNKTGA
jgi:uncharacterized membrane-anchored protein